MRRGHSRGLGKSLSIVRELHVFSNGRGGHAIPSCNSFLLSFDIDQMRKVDEIDGGMMKSAADDFQTRMKTSEYTPESSNSAAGPYLLPKTH